MKLHTVYLVSHRFNLIHTKTPKCHQHNQFITNNRTSYHQFITNNRTSYPRKSNATLNIFTIQQQHNTRHLPLNDCITVQYSCAMFANTFLINLKDNLLAIHACYTPKSSRVISYLMFSISQIISRASSIT